jgi:hypothetical protein
MRKPPCCVIPLRHCFATGNPSANEKFPGRNIVSHKPFAGQGQRLCRICDALLRVSGCALWRRCTGNSWHLAQYLEWILPFSGSEADAAIQFQRRKRTSFAPSGGGSQKGEGHALFVTLETKNRPPTPAPPDARLLL